MSAKSKLEPQNPLILRSHRLMEAFAKSDDERDFYLDRLEGFIVFADLDKPENELALLEEELTTHNDRYCLIPKLTFYETKKIMEGFVNEKVYDIDTKEKLLDIIQSKEARDNFLEFIYDHHAESEKWQQYYQERSRIRIIEWLRHNHYTFVFEEDLEMSAAMLEKLKKSLFDAKPPKDILAARKILYAKSKTYYSNEALNPRPKRGRPPKQAAKAEIEPQITTDIYTTVPNPIRQFLFIPDISSLSAFTFSSKFGSEAEMLNSRKVNGHTSPDLSIESLNQKLAALRSIASPWVEKEPGHQKAPATAKEEWGSDDDEEDEEDFEENDGFKKNRSGVGKKGGQEKKVSVGSSSKISSQSTNQSKKPVKSAKPIKPAKPAKLAKIAKPTKSVKPAKPVKKEKAPAKKTMKPLKRPMKKLIPKKTKIVAIKGKTIASSKNGKKPAIRPAIKITPKKSQSSKIAKRR